MNVKRAFIGATIALALGLAIVGYRKLRDDQRDQSKTPKRARLDDGKEVGIIKL